MPMLERHPQLTFPSHQFVVGVPAGDGADEFRDETLFGYLRSTLLFECEPQLTSGVPEPFRELITKFFCGPRLL